MAHHGTQIPLLSSIIYTQKQCFTSCGEGGGGPQDKQQQAYFNKHVQVDPKACLNICLNSINQSASPSWQKERRKRVTASVAHSILRGKKKETRLKYFVGGSNYNNDAMQYGTDMEEEARQKYMQVSGNVVVPCGLLVKPDECWISASPDGLFLDKDNKLGVLEIKCPSSCKDKKIWVPKYLTYKPPCKLIKSHPYYTQVQIQMYVTGAKFAHFFVYSTKDYKLTTVPLDQVYLKNIIPKLEALYFTELLKSLLPTPTPTLQ